MKNMQKVLPLIFVFLSWQAALGQDAQQPKPEAAQPALPDSAVLVTIDGQTLTYGQAKILVENRLAPDEVSAANRWIDIQLKYQKALEKQLDQKTDIQFMVDMIKKHFLSYKLDMEVADSVPAVSEEKALEEYNKNIARYTRPMNISLQHITVQERQQAEKIIEEAKQSGAEFDALVEKYSQAADKSKKGKIDRLNLETAKRQLGEETAQALKTAQNNDILGPFLGIKGFEVIKVVSYKPEEVMEFAKVKDGILQGMKGQAAEEAKTKLLDELKAASKMEKSPDLLKLEEEAKARQEEAQKKAEEARKNAQPKIGMGGN
ncbi:MAG: peptidylprolyl isomerase [Planctomycetes bacterium ADurb.Bin412]|nr:MAG: peptidylprolyl isomerase [Planctomycetes bacterium ADurb.Bin412]